MQRWWNLHGTDGDGLAESAASCADRSGVYREERGPPLNQFECLLVAEKNATRLVVLARVNRAKGSRPC